MRFLVPLLVLISAVFVQCQNPIKVWMISSLELSRRNDNNEIIKTCLEAYKLSDEFIILPVRGF